MDQSPCNTAFASDPRKTIRQTMALMVRILFVILFHGFVISASDPDPVQDFCVANTDPATTIPCKNSSLVTVEDFIFSGLNSSGSFNSMGLARILADVNSFPGLNTQGISFARNDLKAGAVAAPHVHPRATEIAYILQGKVYQGFVDTENRVFARVMEPGEVLVIPRGLVHFHMNVGENQATAFAVYSSQNPGTSMITDAIFGCEMKDEIIEKAFGLNAEDISKVREYLKLCSNLERLKAVIRKSATMQTM